MLAQKMPEAGQSVRRPFKSACKIENGQRCLQIEFAGQDPRRHCALRRVGPVLGFGEPTDCCKRILGIDTMTFGNLGRGSSAGCGRLRAANSCSAEFS